MQEVPSNQIKLPHYFVVHRWYKENGLLYNKTSTCVCLSLSMSRLYCSSLVFARSSSKLRSLSISRSSSLALSLSQDQQNIVRLFRGDSEFMEDQTCQGLAKDSFLSKLLPPRIFVGPASLEVSFVCALLFLL